MSSVSTAFRARLSRADAVTTDAFLILATTVGLAGFGGVFWLIAGHVQSIAQVGVAGTLLSAAIVVSYVAQLGMGTALVASIPRSDRPAQDIALSLTVTGGLGLALGYLTALLLPLLAPATTGALAGSRGLVYAAVVAGTSVNLTTDSVFLARRQLRTNLMLTGVAMGVVKCLLPSLFVSSGAFGLVLASGIASIGAAVACAYAGLRGLPAATGWKPSTAFRGSYHIGVASYVVGLAEFVPLVAVPVMIIRFAGAEQNGAFFVAFQIATMLNSVAYAVGRASFADGSRSSERIGRAMRTAAMLMVAAVGGGSAVIAAIAPFLLSLFGDDYASQGAPTLRVLCAASCALAVTFWIGILLTLQRRLRASIAVAVVASLGVVAILAALPSTSALAGACAWLGGQLLGAVVGALLLILGRTQRRTS
ncbi:hypothetical protein Back2_00320 [Nocardioides baekrokdamisoli]|uniref:O-antigen/teichoic acid export membrane protein n=1 Tax=Nocardioides baekrokdamisoli TaxID=1804624 RepID=A0A3G9IIA0_9ACTN|nr:hypothetical protein [Nocardioides baekrokdamisoli]BBH15745.1 hypothetical protein Back2_00320 [Nocardioides baekrokdamisoli]